jgi:hypothetical protein
MIRIVTWFTRLLVFRWACVAHASPVPPVRCGAQIGSPGCQAKSENVFCPGADRMRRPVTTSPSTIPTRTPSISTTRCWNARTFRGPASASAGSTRPSSDVPEDTSCRAVKEMFDPGPPASSPAFGRGMRLGIFWLEHEQEKDWKPGSQRPRGGRVGGFHANTDGWIYACLEITLNRRLPEGLFRCRPGLVETRACSDSNRGCQPLRSLHAVTFEVGGRGRNCFQLNR